MKRQTAIHQELQQAYSLMHAHFGHQHWWPGETPFEVCVGAILTQNTQWSNVVMAIQNLKHAGVLEPKAMYALPQVELASLIRPAGYFNVKAARLRSFLKVLVEECHGQLSELFQGAVETVRERLLEIRGIGPETADSMLLYAGNQISFVVDTYTRRIFSRHGWVAPDIAYHDLRHLCQTALSHLPELARLDYWADYHAQLVMVGKSYCRPRTPRCSECPLGCLLKKTPTF